MEERAMQKCPRCHSEKVVPNGSAAGKPKKRCKPCGYQFTRTTPRGKPLQAKILAVLLYLSGLSMRRIATLCDVSTQAILNWIRAFAHEHYEKPKPDGAVVILELDEMWQYVKKNGTSSGSGKRWMLLQVDCLTGNVDAVTKRR
jgi:transposase-like protein